MHTNLSKDVVVSTVKALISKVGEFMGGGHHVKIPIGDIGILLCERRNVSFKMAEVRNGRGGPPPGPTGEVESWVDTFMKRKEEDKEREIRQEQEQEQEQEHRWEVSEWVCG